MLERNRCAGVALLTVLFILVLLTTLSVYMLEDEHLALRRIGNQREKFAVGGGKLDRGGHDYLECADLAALCLTSRKRALESGARSPHSIYGIHFMYST